MCVFHMSTQIPATIEFVSEEEKARRIIAHRLNPLKVFAELSAPDGLTGWRLVGAEPDPEPTSDEDCS